MQTSVAKIMTGMEAGEIRSELDRDTADLRRRRAIIGLSMVGLGIAAAASLLQTRVIKHLPDPPIGNFNADRVMTSDEAYQFGIPDATLALTGFAANVSLAAWGGSERSTHQPIVPLVASAKSAAELAMAGWYFYQMPVKLKTWCAYCIAGGGVYLAIFALTIPEARRAMSALRQKE